MAALKAGVEARRAELEEMILAGAHGISNPQGVAQARQVEVTRRAVSAGVDYNLIGIEGEGAEGEVPIPGPILRQAREAARSGFGHGEILRRYCAGNLLFADVLIEEAGRVGLPRVELGA